MESLKVEWKEAVEHVVRTQKSGSVVVYIDDFKNGLQVAVTVNPKTKQIIIAFRGSDEKVDWITNFKGYQTRLKDNIFVHAGFNALINSHLKALNCILDELVYQHRGFAIIVTGHSSGGALSTIFGYLIAQRLAPKRLKVRVVSFGSPRVGNHHFRTACANTANLTVTRVTYRRDLVTASPVLNYYHVGSTVLHLSDGRPQVFLNYQYSMMQYSRLRCRSLADHFATNYWAALKKSVTEEPTTVSAQRKPKIAVTADA